MTAPHPAEAKDFDEISKELGEAADKPDLSKLALGSGDDVPEDLRGKTAAELLAQLAGAKAALGVSETARKDAAEVSTATQARLAALEVREPAPAAPSADVLKELSPEELQKLYDEEPLKAIAVMNDQTSRKLLGNLDARISGLAAGNADTAEQRAKDKYKDEFELFEPQIVDLLKNVDRNVMASDKAWDDALAYITGKPDNRQKLIDRAVAAAQKTTEEAAHEAQAAITGASLTAASRVAPVTAPTGELDETEKEIVRVMAASGIDIDESSYKTWKKVG